MQNVYAFHQAKCPCARNTKEIPSSELKWIIFTILFKNWIGGPHMHLCTHPSVPVNLHHFGWHWWAKMSSWQKQDRRISSSKQYGSFAAPAVHWAQGRLQEQVCDDLCIPLNYRWDVTQQKLLLLFRSKKKPKIHLFRSASLAPLGQNRKL